jgi:ubiquinone/menaquinone biosynthesis C-methylase UbiE
MVEAARRLIPESSAGRVRFEVADAAALPFPDGSFDLVVLLNMIPFFDELARVTVQDGTLIVASFSGPETPIYTPFRVLRERLEAHGFARFEELRAGTGDALLARRGATG